MRTLQLLAHDVAQHRLDRLTVDRLAQSLIDESLIATATGLGLEILDHGSIEIHVHLALAQMCSKRGFSCRLADALAAALEPSLGKVQRGQIGSPSPGLSAEELLIVALFAVIGVPHGNDPAVVFSRWRVNDDHHAPTQEADADDVVSG